MIKETGILITSSSVFSKSISYLSTISKNQLSSPKN